MSTVVVAGPQRRYKDTYAASSDVGLVVRANGEEKVAIIDRFGNIATAGITAPSVAPTISNNGAGTLTNNKWVAYAYAYVIEDVYQFVEADIAINGSLAPRSNGSPATAHHITGGAKQLTVQVTKTTQANVNKIYIFRTAYFDTEDEAQTAGDAQVLFYVGEVANNGVAGTTTFNDNTKDTSLDQIEMDNYVAPQFQFVIYEDPYWWGIGNFAFSAEATWTNGGVGATGLLTLTGADSWFNGRDGQIVTLEGVETGGMDGRGSFKFKWISSTTAGVTIDGTTLVALPGAGEGTVTIQGPATTLYRSKRRNPFAWGRTIVVGSANVPALYTHRVGGGFATAIAIIPNEQLLKIDCEFPTRALTFNLQAAGTDNFEQTQRKISDTHSVSSHWSQFTAVTREGHSVLWGLDYKNFAILQCNGITQGPISGPIPRILRQLSTVKSQQLLAHGAHEPRLELNCMWLPRRGAASLIDFMVYQHTPTGFWGFVEEHDVLCSAQLEDTETGTNKVFVGTQSGYIGQAFAEGYFSNWTPPSGLLAGTIASADVSSLVKEDDEDFNTLSYGIEGNWCLITDANGQQEQWARISAYDETSLTFDLIRPYITGPTNAFNPIPAEGWKFYIGMIECKLRKDFDLKAPNVLKNLQVFGLTQQNDDDGTFIRFYREDQAELVRQFAIKQNFYHDGTLSDYWNARLDIPSNSTFAFGIEVINRAYSDWRFLNFLMDTGGSRT